MAGPSRVLISLAYTRLTSLAYISTAFTSASTSYHYKYYPTSCSRLYLSVAWSVMICTCQGFGMLTNFTFSAEFGAAEDQRLFGMIKTPKGKVSLGTPRISNAIV